MILKIINIIIFFLIQVIEKYQFRNEVINQDNPLHKIKNITFVEKENIFVQSPEGWVKVTEINETQPYRIWYVKTHRNKKIFCADTHILYDCNDQEIMVQNLRIGDWIQTENGPEKIITKDVYQQSNCMIDLTVDSNQMRYYVNGITSHNTICAAIVLLHYAIFNTNRGIMIVANKAETVVEIVDKIKNIYKLLPFFIKPGIINWNTRTIVFDNGCRIKSQARSKEPAIGFTIDFLYMDEFAHIPPNTINHYYKAAVPTVSSIKDSKIVITSTPNGANLFKDLVLGASLPEGHPDKNMFNLIKVYWYQVPDGTFEDQSRGTRFDAKIYPLHHELRNHELTIQQLNDNLKNLGFKTVIDNETTDTGNRQLIRVLHENGKSDINIIRQLKLGSLDLVRIATITNWKEQETKLIGGEEAFNQEYGLQFIAGSKRVLSANVAQSLEHRSVNYESLSIEVLDTRLRVPYDELRFAPDFVESERNRYYWLTILDISEGLGQDDSVMTMFRLLPRPIEYLQNIKIKSLYDAFYFKQTAIYNFNCINHKTDLPELVYLMNYDYIDPSRVKIILEYNGPGSSFLTAMPFVFNQENQFGNYPFIRYFHNRRDKKKKIGIKVTRNKKEQVKSYIEAIEHDKLYVDERKTLEQMDSFIKVETRSGDFTYKADSGHDDIVMTLVNGSTIFDTQDYKNMCHAAYQELDNNYQNIIDKSMDLEYNPDAISYKQLTNILQKNKGTYKKSTRFQSGKGRYVRTSKE